MALSDDEERRRWFRREVLPLERGLIDYAARFCRRGDCEPTDLVHETFARLIGYSGWRDIENPRAFATQTLKNCAIDASRRRSVVPIDVMVSINLYDAPDPAAGPEQTVLAQDELRELRAAVTRLPNQCRKVFTLRKIYGLSHAEIAVRLGISVSTVEKHLVKGLRLCSEMLGRTAPVAEKREAKGSWAKRTSRIWTR